MLCKRLDLVPVLLDELRLRPLVRRDELGDIEDFSVVEDAWTDFAQAQRFVAFVTAILEVGAVLQFLLSGELEDLFANGKLSVYLLLGEAEVDDVEEAWTSMSRRGVGIRCDVHVARA